MSRSSRSDVHRALEAGAAQRPETLTRSSGHLEPRRLLPPHGEEKLPLRRTTQSREDTPHLLTAERTRTRRTLVLASVKQKEFCSWRSKQHPAPECSSHREEDDGLPEIVHRPSAPPRPNVSSQNRSGSLSDPGGQQLHSSQTVRKVLSDEGELKVKQRFGRKLVTRRGFRPGSNVAEMHERKLQEELEKLPAPSWPSRDRLVVFSDVFDDVCEGSPVFGRILREIKTEYDSYIDHMMAAHLSRLHAPTNTSVKDVGADGVSEAELEEAEKEVYLLEEEARAALAEKKRVQSELQNVPAAAGPEDSHTERKSSAVDRLRLQVLNTWREVQHLEEEMRDKMASTATTTATERRIAAVKKEIMRLIASNHCLKTANKDLENNIDTVLRREKASRSTRRMLWDGIRGDLQTERSTS